MQVILLEKIAHVGDLGDVVKVKDGYGRNFLIPTSAGLFFDFKSVEAEAN